MEGWVQVLGNSIRLEFRTHPGEKQKSWCQTEKAEKSILYSDNRIPGPWKWHYQKTGISADWRRLKLEIVKTSKTTVVILEIFILLTALKL